MKTTFPVSGMHCRACTQRLTEAFGRLPGVRAVSVTLDPPAATLESSLPLSSEAVSRAARGAGDYTVGPPQPSPSATEQEDLRVAAPTRKTSLFPLVLIVGFIAGVTALTTYFRGNGSAQTYMLDFMAGFFLVFSFFKLLDLHGFAVAFRAYDVIAQRSRLYALAYPFIELALGTAYLLRWQPVVTNAVTLVFMLIGSLGVLRSLRAKRKIQCACLGTTLNLPMTTVTLVEDLAMAGMALAALLWNH